MDDLVEWLRAQLDDDERIAREAGSRALTWPARGTWYLEGVEHNVIGEEEAFCHQHNVEHIARHDPARVLREVEVKRKILDEVVDEATGLDIQVDSEFRVGTRDTAAEPYLGDVLLKLLALPYADRPGYRQEWRP